MAELNMELWYLHRDDSRVVLRVSAGRVTYFENGIEGGSYSVDDWPFVLGEKITAEDAHSRIPAYSKPSQPTKIPVRLWVSERITYEPGSDWPVRCGENPPSGQGSWVEIHPSPDGFFVNKQS